MSRLSDHGAATMDAGLTPREIALRWTIGGATREATPSELVVRVDVSSGRLAATVGDEPMSDASVTISEDHEHGLLHIDAPGLVSATLRQDEHGLRLLYARTGLLTKMNIPGGRVDAPTMMLSA